MDKYSSRWSLTEKWYSAVQVESEEEVLEKIAEHAEKAHEIRLTEEMRGKAISVMRMAA